MDNTIFANVKKLFDYEMYSEVLSLASILQTLFRNDRTILTTEQEYQLILFQANSFYMERKYNPATPLYRESIQLKKQMNRMKCPHLATIEQNYEQFGEMETKYRLAICLREIQQPKKAIIALQSFRNRSPKMNMLLAKLLHHNNTDNLATQAYKDVLLECPLALDAIRSLLEIGVNGIDVNSLIVNICSSPQCSDWLGFWIKGHDQMFSRKLSQAADTFKLINLTSKIRNNEKLLALIGEVLYFCGNFDGAFGYLTNANSLNPNLVDGLMPLAVLYAKKNKIIELERLATPSIQISEYCSEHWFVIAQHLHADDKHDKAIYFIQKSIIEDPRNVEAYILKAKILYQLHKFNGALVSLKTAQGIANYRFEIYKGLTQCFMAMGRLRNGQTVAAQSVRYFKTSPRSYVLLARALLWPKDAALTKKAKTFLDKALELDEYYFPAVLTLAETLQTESCTPEAVKILRKQVAKYPNCKLYAILGDLMAADKDMDGALDYYTIALNLDPNNTQALAGLNAIGNPARPGGTKPNDTSYVASSSLDEPNDETQSLDMSEISPPSEREFWSAILDVDLNP